jgi:hypothetical protein
VKLYTILPPWSSDFATGFIPEGLAFQFEPEGAPSSPLVFEWEAGSDRIGDFVWAVLRIAVTARVRSVLKERFTGVVYLPVDFRQDPRVKRPTRVTKRTKKRVWLPYEGPPLIELWATAWVQPDMERSSFRVVGIDPGSGEPNYKLDGIEAFKSRWDPVEHTMSRWREPREPGKGLFIREEALQGASIFRIYPQPGRLLCTEAVKDCLEEHEITNVAFLESGETF